LCSRFRADNFVYVLCFCVLFLGDNACSHSTFNCPASDNICDITCDDGQIGGIGESCLNSTFDMSQSLVNGSLQFHIYNQFHSMFYSDIYCPHSAIECNITVMNAVNSSERVFDSSSSIFVGNFTGFNLDCDGTDACRTLTVYGGLQSDLSIQLKGGSVGKYMSIFAHVFARSLSIVSKGSDALYQFRVYTVYISLFLLILSL
jgi:hypothetical protein